jgi:hypothetical protein
VFFRSRIDKFFLDAAAKIFQGAGERIEMDLAFTNKILSALTQSREGALILFATPSPGVLRARPRIASKIRHVLEVPGRDYFRVRLAGQDPRQDR